MSRSAEIGLRIFRRAPMLERAAEKLGQGARHGVVSIADQVVASATTFLTGAVIGRICAKEEFGLYTLGFSVLTLLMTIQVSLISTPYMIQAPRLDGLRLRAYSGSALLHQITFGAVAAGCTGLAGHAIWPGNVALGQTLLAVGAVLIFLLLRDYVRQCCFAHLAYGRALFLDMILAVLQLGGLLTLSVAGLLSSTHAFLMLGFACALTATHWLFATRAERTFSASQAWGDFKQNWIAGRWLVASGLVWALSMNLYAWVVAGFHGTAMAGSWAAALGVMTLINPIMLGIQNVLGPRIMHAFANGGPGALRTVVRDAALRFCAVLLGFSASMYLFGDVLVTTIYGAKYTGSGTLVFVLALNASVMTVGYVVSRGLFALDLARVDFFVNFLALACFLAFGVALVRAVGPMGAAMAQLGTNALATAVRAGAFMRYSRPAEVAL